MADDSGLAAELAAIKERNEALRSRYGYVGGLLVLAKAQHDVPRLLAAVDKALAMAVQWVTEADELDRDIDRARKSHDKGDHEQADTNEEIAQTLRDHAEALRDAIARELTGKAADGG